MSIAITLPDKSVREAEAGISVLDFAKSIAISLGKKKPSLGNSTANSLT